MIYLDNAASTPVEYDVKRKLVKMLDVYGNPSSIHSKGTEAKKAVIEAQQIIAEKINCDPEDIFFTTGATMSNNLVISGFIGNVYCSEIEHDDIRMAVLDKNIYADYIPVYSNGTIDLNKLIEVLSDYRFYNELYCIQLANSEIGTIQDIKTISDIIHDKPNRFIHVDATQYIAHYPVDVKEMGIDSLSMSGQKIGCIKGTGILYMSKKLQKLVKPTIWGMQGFVGGTENTLGIACLGEAFRTLHYSSYITKDKIKKRDILIKGLDGELIGSLLHRLPNNVCMLFKGVDAQSLVLMLNERGICCSAGSACSSNSSEPSATLLAIGLSEEDAASCVRFTLGDDTKDEDLRYVVSETNALVKMLRGEI